MTTLTPLDQIFIGAIILTVTALTFFLMIYSTIIRERWPQAGCLLCTLIFVVSGVFFPAYHLGASHGTDAEREYQQARTYCAKSYTKPENIPGKFVCYRDLVTWVNEQIICVYEDIDRIKFCIDLRSQWPYFEPSP